MHDKITLLDGAMLLEMPGGAKQFIPRSSIGFVAISPGEKVTVFYAHESESWVIKTENPEKTFDEIVEWWINSSNNWRIENSLIAISQQMEKLIQK